MRPCAYVRNYFNRFSLSVLFCDRFTLCVEWTIVRQCGSVLTVLANPNLTFSSHGRRHLAQRRTETSESLRQTIKNNAFDLRLFYYYYWRVIFCGWITTPRLPLPSSPSSSTSLFCVHCSCTDSRRYSIHMSIWIFHCLNHFRFSPADFVPN